MAEIRRALLEFLIVGLLTLGVGLAGNALNGDGLSLGKNYFGLLQNQPVEKPEDPLAPEDVQRPAEGEDDVIARVSERLREAGLQPIDHDGVLELFRDENYEYELHVFVDARNDDHYLGGHIPGAYHFDHFHMERYLDEVMAVSETAEKVVVYCYGKDCTDSEITARHLIDMGVEGDRVFIYVGGIQSWCEAGLRVEMGVRGSGQLKECEQ